MCLMVHPFLSPSCGVRPHSRRSAVFLQSNSLKGLGHISPMLLNRPEAVSSDSKQKQTTGTNKLKKEKQQHHIFWPWSVFVVWDASNWNIAAAMECLTLPTCITDLPNYRRALALASSTQCHLLYAPNWDQNSLLSNHHLLLPIPAMKPCHLRNHVFHPEPPNWV